MQPAGDGTTPLDHSSSHLRLIYHFSNSGHTRCGTVHTRHLDPDSNPRLQGTLKMQRQPKRTLAPSTTLRTLCLNCCGAGHIACSRATHSDNPGVLGGFQMHTCPTCEGQRWLAGFQPPV